MAVLNLSINGRIQEIACDDSQVPRVEALGQMVDGIARDLLGQLGNIPDSRLMVMVALTLADELTELKENLASASAGLDAAFDGDIRLASHVEALADRIEGIASRLERS